MWKLQDGTKSGRGYLSILKDGKRVADVFPFASGTDGVWVREQAARIVDQMNVVDMVKASSGEGVCTNAIPLPGPEH